MMTLKGFYELQSSYVEKVTMIVLSLYVHVCVSAVCSGLIVLRVPLSPLLSLRPRCEQWALSEILSGRIDHLLCKNTDRWCRLHMETRYPGIFNSELQSAKYVVFVIIVIHK